MFQQLKQLRQHYVNGSQILLLQIEFRNYFIRHKYNFII